MAVTLKGITEDNFIDAFNLKLKKDLVTEKLRQKQADPELTLENAKNPRTVIIDYGGANVAKPLHVGHLRAAVIGEAIKRMGQYVGQ